MNKIAYICDGYDKCSLEPGCFLREDPQTATDWCCNHTTNPKHAINDICDDPENHPERFVGYKVTDSLGDESVRYYELMPGEEVYE